MPNEILSNRLQNFTPEYRDFIMSDFTETAGIEAQSLYRWDEDTREVFENMLFLHITLFLDRFEFIEAIVIECSLSISQAIQLVDRTLSKLPYEMVLAQKKVTDTLNEDNIGLVNDKERIDYLGSIPKQKVTSYLYAKTSTLVSKICKKYNLTTDEIIFSCRTLLGDIILGFYKIEDTIPLLQQELGLDAKTAALLGADVLDFLAPLSDPNWQPPAEIESDDSHFEETAAPAAEEPASVPTSFTEIVTTPDTEPTAVVSSIPELRTMAGDMQEERSPVRSTFNAAAAIDEPVYTSTQPTIERKAENVPSYTAPMYEQPKPNLDVPIEKPRWS